VSDYQLGEIAINPRRVAGPIYAEKAQRVGLLSDGVSTLNEVLQQGSQPALEIAVSGALTSGDDVDALRELHRSKETVLWSDPLTSEMLAVRVFNLTLEHLFAGYWEYSMLLVESDEEIEEPGS
jgi:hypothetical protein